MAYLLALSPRIASQSDSPRDGILLFAEFGQPLLASFPAQSSFFLALAHLVFPLETFCPCHMEPLDLVRPPRTAVSASHLRLDLERRCSLPKFACSLLPTILPLSSTLPFSSSFSFAIKSRVSACMFRSLVRVAKFESAKSITHEVAVKFQLAANLFGGTPLSFRFFLFEIGVLKLRRQLGL